MHIHMCTFMFSAVLPAQCARKCVCVCARVCVSCAAPTKMPKEYKRKFHSNDDILRVSIMTFYACQHFQPFQKTQPQQVESCSTAMITFYACHHFNM